MNRRLSQLAFALAAMLVLAACGPNASPTAPPMLFNDQSLSGEAKLPKIDICHLDDEGNYNLININGNAQQSHLAHGDILPILLPNGSLACEVPSGCDVTFDSVTVTSDHILLPIPGGFDTTVEWNTSGSEADGTVTYVVEGVFFNSAGDVNTGINEDLTTRIEEQTNQNGSGSFSSSFFVSISDTPDAYRIRAICGSGDEVLSIVVER